MTNTKIIAQDIRQQAGLNEAKTFCESTHAYFEKNNILVSYFPDMTDETAAALYKKVKGVYETMFDRYDFPNKVQLHFSTSNNKGKCHNPDCQSYKLPGIRISVNSTEAQIRNILRAATPENRLEHACRTLRLELFEKGITVQWTRQTDVHAVRNTLLKLKEISGTMDLSCIHMITIANERSELSHKGVSIKERTPVNELSAFLQNTVRNIKERTDVLR